MLGQTALSQFALACLCLKAALTGPVTTGSTPSGASAKACCAEGELSGKTGRVSFSVAADCAALAASSIAKAAEAISGQNRLSLSVMTFELSGL
jgi:hypothetical protein